MKRKKIRVMLLLRMLLCILLLCIVTFNTVFANPTESSEVQSTEAPTTEAPTTEAPTTEAPTTEAPTTETPTTEASTTEAETSEEESSEVDSSEVDSSEVDSSEVDSSEVDSSEVNSSEVDSSEVDSSEVDSSEVNSSEVDSSEVDSSQSDTSESNTSESEAEETQFNVEIEYGLKGVVNTLVDIPISVYISNLEDNFEGILRITSELEPNPNYYYPQNEDNTPNVAYEYDLILAEGESKTFEVLLEYHYSAKQSIRVEILDLNENEKFSKLLSINAMDSQLGVIGVLSDDYPSLTYFYGHQILATYNTVIHSSIFELVKDDIPTSANKLSSINTLIINGFNTSQLSRQQCQAIQEWVYQGGMLIIGTGPDASQTLSMFQDENKFSKDFLDITIGEAIEGELTVLSAQKDGYDGIISFTKEDGIPLLSIKGADIINNSHVPTSNISYDDKLALIQKKQIGNGAIIVTSFNLGLEPIASLDWNSYLAKSILNDVRTNYFIDALDSIDLRQGRQDNINYQMYDMLEKLFDVKVPNITIYIGIFVLYVLIAGPLGYFLLKSKDKREWIWELIPVTTILFTVFIAVLSLPSRITGPLVSNFTVLELEENFINQKIFVGLRTPDIKRYTINLNLEQCNFAPLESEIGDVKLNQKFNWDYSIKNTTSGYQITTNHGQTFATDYMMFEDVKTRQDCSLDVILTEATGSYFVGSVTNNTGYDMVDAFICYGSTTVYLGNMEDGERKTFKIKDNLYLPQFSSTNLSNYFQADETIRPNIENAYRYVAASNNQKLSRSQCVIFGYVENLGEELVAEENNIKGGSAGIIYRELNIPTQAVEGVYIKDIYKNVVNKNYQELAYNNYLMKVSSFEMELKFAVSKVEALYKKKPLYGGDCTDVIVWGYNYETKEFDKLFNNSDEMTFNDSCPYVNVEGKMLLRFECTDFEKGKKFIPGIALIGE